MTGVRFRDGSGFEGKCDGCMEWWPLDGDYWSPDRGLNRCRACHVEQNREYKKLVRQDPKVRAKEVAYYKRWRQEHLTTAREAHARRQRLRYQNDPVFREHKKAQNRRYAEANRERVRAKNREWYQRKRAA